MLKNFKFIKRKSKRVWVSRDSKKGYDNEILIWTSKRKPRINPDTGVFSVSFLDEDVHDYDFICIDENIFTQIFKIPVKSGECFQVQMTIERIT